MKSFTSGFIAWFVLDVCLALSPCALFAVFVSGGLSDGKKVAYGLLAVCGLLVFIMLARLLVAGRTTFRNYDVALGWRILAFLLHFGVLAAGMYVVAFVIVLLLGAGVSVGEPAG